MLLSLDQIREMIRGKIEPPPDSEGPYPYVTEVYLDCAIIERDGKYFKLPFTIADDHLEFADEVEVEKEYVPVEQTQVQSARLLGAKDPEGMVWDVVIIQPGLTLHSQPFYFSEDILKDAAPLFENASCCAFEMPEGMNHLPDSLLDVKKLLVRNKIGWFEKAKLAAEGIVAELHLLASAKWLGENLLTAFKQGKTDILGLSIDAPVRAKAGEIAGKVAKIVTKILGVDSVDVVDMPAAGGRFVRAIANINIFQNPPLPQDPPLSKGPAAGRGIISKKEEKEMKEKLLRLLAGMFPDLMKGKKIEEIKDEEIDGLIAQGEALRAAAAKPVLSNGALEGRVDPPKDDAAMKEIKIMRCEMSLKEKLKDSELPEIAQARLSTIFAGKLFEEKDLDKAIADEKDYLAKFSQVQANPTGVGDDRAQVQMGLAPLDKIQGALDLLVGLRPADYEVLARCRSTYGEEVFPGLKAPDLSGIKPFRGLREAYIYFSGDKDMDGRFHRENLMKDLRAMMSFASDTFSFALGNSLHRRLVRDYLEVDYGERRIINVVAANDFKTREAIKVGYFGMLSTVNPETGDYQELAAYGDTEETYTVGQKGNLVTITRKHIINDDIGVVSKVPGRLGRAARWTFATFVWNFPIANAAMGDGKAWFHADHGNLGAAALSIASVKAALTAFDNQTAPGSGEPISVRGVSLEIPTALRWTAISLNTSEYDGDPALGVQNPIRGYFGANNENIHVNKLLSDATDWYIFGDPSDAEIIEVAFLLGQETPELFLSDQPTVGQMFVADKLQYKIRHEYGGVPVDYRNAYKAVVAG